MRLEPPVAIKLWCTRPSPPKTPTTPGGWTIYIPIHLFIGWIESGWWLGHPSEKYESQLGWLETQYMGKSKKWQPNHQPGIFCPSIHLSTYRYAIWCNSIRRWSCIYLFLYLSISPSVSTHLFINQSIYPSIYLLARGSFRKSSSSRPFYKGF